MNVSRMFAGSAATAHSVCDQDEFGQWRPVCNRFGDEYLAAYQTYVQVSAPEEDFDGRVDLYKLYGLVPCSHLRIWKLIVKQEVQHPRVGPFP